MKAICHREGLWTAFQIAASVAPLRSPKPILRNLKFEAGEDGQAILSATDLELGLRYRVSGVKIEEPGQIMLPTTETGAILRELSDETVTLQSTETGVRLLFGSAKFHLLGEDPLQFPEIPPFEEQQCHQIKASDFQLMLRRTLFAAATENTKYALASVLIDKVSDNELMMVATDAKRLACMSGPAKLAGAFPQGFTLLPPKAMQLLGKVLLDPNEMIDFVVRENDVLFRTSKMVLYSRLVEGRFPRYQDAIPKDLPTRIPLPVGPFHGVLRQAKIVTKGESKAVLFQFENGLLTLKSRSPEAGDSEIRLPIGYEGKKLQLNYDPQFLIDAMKVLEPEDEIMLELGDSKKASVFRAKDEFQYVVMPLTKDHEPTPARTAAAAVEE